jgi:hypothetical protein
VRTTSRIGTVWCGLVIMLAAGCGGGAERLSATAYAQRAGGICVRANVAIARVTIPPMAERAAAERALRRIVEIQRSSIDGLRGLRSPDGFGNLPDRWIALLDQGTDELQLMRTALAEGRPVDAAAYGQKATDLLTRAQVLVTGHGMTSCGGPELTTDLVRSA